jgi:hypothetical protein
VLIQGPEKEAQIKVQCDALVFNDASRFGKSISAPRIVLSQDWTIWPDSLCLWVRGLLVKELKRSGQDQSHLWGLSELKRSRYIEMGIEGN